MVTEKDERAAAKRRLILRDSLGFLTLLVVTLVLFGVTLLLFRSFSAHRADLAVRWSQRGVAAMKAGKPEQAVVALRTTLGYAPDDRHYQLLLAQALGEAGEKDPHRTDESYAYFMTLWERQPGDGFINLELARLAARRGDRSAAVDFYRASIYGTWQGDGVTRRAEVRLELARYLIASREYPAARVELLVAAGNVPESGDFDRKLAELLEEAQDGNDAWNLYQKAIALTPRDAGLLQEAGELAYGTGNWEAAHRLLSRAQAVRSEEHVPADAGLAKMEGDAGRIAELVPLGSLPGQVKAARILAARRTAKKRLDTCVAGLAGSGGQIPPELQGAVSLWTGPAGKVKAADLREDSGQQNAAMELVYETEIAAEAACPAATGDDALLLVLARRAGVAAQNASAQQGASALGGATR